MFLNVHTHHFHAEETSIMSYNFGEATNHQQIHSVGVHPYFWKGNPIDSTQFERELVHSAALGESGLDARSSEPIDNQRKLFLWQIELARVHHKTVIVHCVRAWGELFSVLKQYRRRVQFIIHNFNQNEFILKELIRFDSGISVGASIFNNTSNTRKLLSKIPIELLFIETDNNNCRVETLYQFLSQTLSIPVEKLQYHQLDNWKAFKLLDN